MTARSTSRSRASCCCPCGLAPVVTVAFTTAWLNRLSLGSKIDQPQKRAHLLRAFIACAATAVQTSLHLATRRTGTAGCVLLCSVLMYYVYGLQLYVRNCIVHTAGTYTGARIMYLVYMCVLATVAMCVCVFKNYVCRQAKVYRVLAICRTYTHTNCFFSHVAIRNSLRSKNIYSSSTFVSETQGRRRGKTLSLLAR